MAPPAEARDAGRSCRTRWPEKILLGDIRDNSTVKITSGSDRLNFRAKPAAVATEEAA